MRRALTRRLAEAERVTQVSAHAGSGKTILLRSWIAEAGLADSAAWVQVRPQESDPQRFWISVVDALRDTIAGSKLVRPLIAAPALSGGAVVERLLDDLSPLGDRLWLIIDDLDELRSAEALRQLQFLVQHARPELRFVLAGRHDLLPGLHRLRLEGQLTELCAGDLRFDLDEARTLFDMAGIALSDSALAQLHARTEGWAAGLRLAALSLAGHPDPERCAARFSGSERTVAAYLLAEVLERQSDKVRRLLVCTSMCERINGELADLLTGDSGGERILEDLERAGAFVVVLDARRSWFRYHHLFADLLQLELRRTRPGEVAALHGTAARWYATRGWPAEAVRHARAALDWDMTGGLLSGHRPDPVLSGPGITGHQLLGPRRSHAGRWVSGQAGAGEMGRRDPGKCPPGSSARSLTLAEPLTESETRVLRYLPTHLTAMEIASELHVSVSTVKTHMSHLYAKLGSHRRTEAVDRARSLGLLAPFSHLPAQPAGPAAASVQPRRPGCGLPV